jgi:hypothetical protein
MNKERRKRWERSIPDFLPSLFKFLSGMKSERPCERDARAPLLFKASKYVSIFMRDFNFNLRL